MIKEKIEKIMDVMNEIEYGFKDEEGNNIIDNNPKNGTMNSVLFIIYNLQMNC